MGSPLAANSSPSLLSGWAWPRERWGRSSAAGASVSGPLALSLPVTFFLPAQTCLTPAAGTSAGELLPGLPSWFRTHSEVASETQCVRPGCVPGQCGREGGERAALPSREGPAAPPGVRSPGGSAEPQPLYL